MTRSAAVSCQPALYVQSGSAGQTASCPVSEVVSETPEAQEAPNLFGSPGATWSEASRGVAEMTAIAPQVSGSSAVPAGTAV